MVPSTAKEGFPGKQQTLLSVKLPFACHFVESRTARLTRHLCSSDNISKIRINYICLFN